MKYPEREAYEKNNVAAYRNLSLATNRHKQIYLRREEANCNKGVKLVARLFRKRTGHQLTYLNYTSNAAIDYVHWDDPNKLVNQL